jgi:hypothetical protein
VGAAFRGGATVDLSIASAARFPGASSPGLL